jgi:uncharacterized protein
MCYAWEMRFLACALALLACESRTVDVPTGVPRDASADALLPPPDVGAVRIASYNVQLYFDTVCDSAMCGPNDYERALSPMTFTEKASRIAKAGRALNADVLMIEEIENETCAKAIQAAAPEYASLSFGETGFKASLDVAVFAKDTIEKVIPHRGERFKLPDGRMERFTREFLEVDLDRKGVKYTVYVAHFKAKTNDDPAVRLGEATAARAIILARHKAEPTRTLVFGGDLNDVPGSPPLAMLESQDANGQLLRVATRDLSAEEQISYRGGIRSAIDHLFLPIALQERHVKGSTKVLGDSATRGLEGSDHAAIVADFRLQD